LLAEVDKLVGKAFTKVA